METKKRKCACIQLAKKDRAENPGKMAEGKLIGLVVAQAIRPETMP